jgi:hypothetical protein
MVKLQSWSCWLVDEHTGTLVVFGDYGTWSYTWGHAGRVEENRDDFRKELLRFSHDYIWRKLSCGVARQLDPDGTAKAIRDYARKYRRSKDLSAKEARELWETAHGLDSEADLIWRQQESDVLSDALASQDLEPVYRVKDEQWLDILVKQHWPEVLKVMQQEVQGG